VQLASQACAHAEPDQILATEEVVVQSPGETSLFLSRGTISPNGFDKRSKYMKFFGRKVDF
jgi:class 3 adenylate cyclase